MENSKQRPLTEASNDRLAYPFEHSLLKNLHTLSEKAVVDRMLEHPAARQLIQQLPSEDFFWLAKKTGEDRLLQVLRLASTEQWQFILDLELWNKDRLDMKAVTLWLSRLHLADPRRLSEWLQTEKEALACYYFFKSIQVEVREPDEADDLEEGFVTLDGLFHVKVRDPEKRHIVEGILRNLADADLLRYQALLSGLAGVIPTEMEEEMYRLKNVRLAEHGFLPPEEALIVYAPLNPDDLNTGPQRGTAMNDVDEPVHDMAPCSLLSLVHERNLLAKSLAGIHDETFLERIRLEFAGLCNQVLSADNLAVNDAEVLKRTCRKSAGYLNLLLEERCGNDMGAAETLLRNNPLISLFRAGFGQAQRLKWKAAAWLKKSWFREKGFSLNFWGEAWGCTLAGLTAKRPLFYQGAAETTEYRDFEHISEAAAAETVLERVKVLDALLAQLTRSYPLGAQAGPDTEPTCHSLLLTLWARQILDLDPSFEPISLNQAKNFFRFLRNGAKRPPYRMLGFEEVFIKDFLDAAAGWAPSAAAVLEETLSLIWETFSREYEQAPLRALDPRFSACLRIKSSPGSPAR